MKRTIEFGKIAYYGSRKINAVSIDIERECHRPYKSLPGGRKKILSTGAIQHH